MVRRKPPRKPQTAPSGGGLLAYAQALGPRPARSQGLRCAICGADWAHFVYGPPLVPTWTRVCREHRAQVDPDLANPLPDWLR